MTTTTPTDVDLDTPTQLGDPELADREPTETHVIKRGPNGEHAGAIVMQAAVEGTPVTALCGHVFIPSRDPKNLPPCQKCMAIVRAHREGSN